MVRLLAAAALFAAWPGSTFAFTSAAPGAHSAPIHAFGIYGEETMEEFGAFHVAWRKAGSTAWTQAGRLGFDHFFRSRTLDLAAQLPRTVEIQLRQEGGMAAQLDQVLLGGNPAHGLTAAEAKKLGTHDKDVVVASGKTFVFRFDRPAGSKLTIAARVEPPKIPHYQFNFPRANRLRPMADGWQPLAYTLGQDRRTLRVDGRLDETWGRTPFIEETRESATGHGIGQVYGWVSNDDKNLYVAFDFPIDNTIQDDFAPGVEDYAKVYVKRGPGITDWQEFQVTDEARRWGRAGFTYTERAVHEHRTYELAIPLKEIEALRGGAAKNDLQLAFGLFGSASEGAHRIEAHYVPSTRAFLATYLKVQSGDWKTFPYARRVSEDGGMLGNEIRLHSTLYPGGTSGELVDSDVDPANGQALAVWANYGPDILARPIFADGSTGAAATVVTEASTAYRNVAVARGAPSAHPFLVVFPTAGDLYAVKAAADGATSGTRVLLPRMNTGNYLGYFDVAHDPSTGGFLQGWTESNNLWVRRLTAAGEPAGTPMLLTNAGYEVALAYDSVNQRFLVSWYQTGGDVFGRLVTSASDATGATVQLRPGTFEHGIAYNPLRGVFQLAGKQGSVLGIYAFDANLQPAGDPVTFTVPSMMNPKLAVNEYTGEALVTFNGTVACCVYDFYATAVGTGWAVASTTAVDFSEIVVGSPVQRTFSLANTGDTQSALKIVSLATAAPFAIEIDGCTGAVLESGEGCDVTLSANPAASGSLNGTLTVTTNQRLTTLAVPLTGSAVYDRPMLSVADTIAPFDDAALPFGALPPGSNLTRYVNLANYGDMPLDVTAVTASAGLSGAFTINTSACAGQTLAPAAGCSVQVTFAPAAVGSFSGTLTITSNAGAAVTVSVSGSGVEAAEPPVALTDPELIAPADGATGVVQPVKFAFKKALAAEGGTVTHTLFVCEDKTFAGCKGEPQQAPGAPWLWLVVPGLAVFARRRSALVLLVAVFLSCSPAADPGPDNQPVETEEVQDLKANTTYYWKVVAKDAQGNETASEVWSFTTK